MDRLELVGSGRDADVYSLGEDRVLRRYREGGDATREAELMAFVAGHGYPVPTIFDVDGADLDVALTAVILAQVAVDDGDGRAALARDMLARFLEQTEGDPIRLLDEAVARRRANRTMTPAELDLLVPAEAVIRELA